jgi:hypothetical protein
MKKISTLILFILFSFINLQAQTVIFNVNLKPNLEDSSFVPSQDKLQIIGNFYPLGPNRSIQLIDEAPIDSIYSAEIRFNSRYRGETLEYNYQIVDMDGNKNTENMVRKITIRAGETELPALYFNAFAW